MEPHPFTPCVFQDELEPLADSAGVDRTVLLHRGREHPAGVHGLPVCLQDIQHRRRQDDGAGGRLCLGLRDQQAILCGAIDLLGDTQFPGFQLQVLPLEGQQFAPPQPGGQLQKEEFKVSLRLGLNQKPLDLLAAQYLHFLCLLGRQLTADGRVGLDQPFVFRPLQRRSAAGVATPYHAVRQPRAIVVGVEEPPGLFQSGVELLEVALGQLVQRDLAQLRDDMSVNAPLVAALGRGAQLGLGVVSVPEVHPVPKGHTGAHPFRLERPQLRLQLVQFFDALGL